MMQKQPLFCRVYTIAYRFNLTQVTVHTIINSYIDYCKRRLYSGKEVQIFGLITIIPDVLVDNYKTTLAYDCYELSKEIGIPSNTVYCIVKEYINSMEQQILEGINVEMRGLVSFHPMYKDGELSVVHSAISTTVREDIQKLNTPIHSVRVHTHKILKYKMKNKEVLGYE